MAYLKSALGIVVVVLLPLLIAACSGARAQAPTPSSLASPTAISFSSSAQQTPAPTAQPKTVTQAKPVAPTTGPRMALDAEAVDFGDVPFETIVGYSFNVRNVGSAPLTLGEAFIKVKEGC